MPDVAKATGQPIDGRTVVLMVETEYVVLGTEEKVVSVLVALPVYVVKVEVDVLVEETVVV